MILGGLPLFALSAQLETEQFVHLDAANWLSIGYSTVFGSAIAYGIFFYFAASGSLTSLSSLTFLTPVFALFFGNLFLGEMLSQVQWVGVGLTLVSIYLINQRDVLAEKFQAMRPVPISEVLQLERSETSPIQETAQLPVQAAEQD
jgi:drug/metabolite transporter (DMT)-like permease